MKTDDRAVAAGGFDGIADYAVEFHEPTRTYRTEFDYTTRTASEAVVWAVAHATDRDPATLPSLYEAIDPDALATLFCTPKGKTTPAGLSVSFEYANQTVTAHGHGTIEIRPSH